MNLYVSWYLLEEKWATLFTTRAVYGGNKSTTAIDRQKWEKITSYTQCNKPVDVKVGDLLVVESTYDLNSHRLRPGATDHSIGAEAMGIMGYAFAAA